MSEFEISRLEGANGFKIVGELDMATAAQLSDAVDVSSEGEVVLDLSELTFIDSHGLRTILELTRARNGNGPVVLRDPSPAVTRLLEIVGMNQHSELKLHRTTERPAVSADTR